MHLLKIVVSLFSIMSQSISDSQNDNEPMPISSDERERPGPGPRIDGVTEVASAKWLSLQTIDYTDEEGNARKWDVATRTTKQGKGADAVVIIPLLMNYKYGASRSTNSNSNSNSNNNDLLLMDALIVEQFRPPMGQSTVEFLAGLIDKDELPETAALRELREETGYVRERCTIIPQVSRQVCMSPLDNPYNDGTLYVSFGQSL